jgi:hypothetical protein
LSAPTPLLAGAHSHAAEVEEVVSDEEVLVDIGAVEPGPADGAAVFVGPVDVPRPLLLWVRGSTDVRFACLNSVSVVGARAATAYGNHVALEMAAALTEHGITVISGGAKGTLFQRICTSSTGGLFMRKPGLIARWGVTLGWSVTYTGSVADGS